MSKWFILMILFNVVLAIFFVLSNYSIWNTVNSYHYSSPEWGPRSIVFVPRIFENGIIILEQMIVILPNYPFWLFWVSMIGNIIFAFLIQASLKKHKTKVD